MSVDKSWQIPAQASLGLPDICIASAAGALRLCLQRLTFGQSVKVHEHAQTAVLTEERLVQNLKVLVNNHLEQLTHGQHIFPL